MAIAELQKEKIAKDISQSGVIVQDKYELRKLKLRVLSQLYRIMLSITKNPFSATKKLYQIKKQYRSIFGESFLTKIAKVDNRYFWRMGVPGFPSVANYKLQTNEVKRFIFQNSRIGLRTVLIAITKKCSLNCEHCFEWENLNQKEQLSANDIISMIHQYQDYGTTQFILSGGEPMLRINDLYKILATAKPGADFWVVTSGLGLKQEQAEKLKSYGLTGVMVSLDHFNPDKHNAFRGFDQAYEWAIKAVQNANSVGLVTTLTLCVTKEFISRENLDSYMKLAKSLWVAFVQLIEPRATGRYAGKDVLLDEKELYLLDQFYLEYNSSPKYNDYPIINYLGYHQRKVGCFGAGNRFFYVDTDGDAHICPYCSGKAGKVKEHSVEEMLDLLSGHSCHIYDKSKIY